MERDLLDLDLDVKEGRVGRAAALFQLPGGGKHGAQVGFWARVPVRRRRLRDSRGGHPGLFPRVLYPDDYFRWACLSSSTTTCWMGDARKSFGGDMRS